MATRNFSTGNTNFLTGIGGAITAGDDVLMEEGADYIVTGLDQAGADIESLQIRSDLNIGYNADGTVAGILEVDISASSDAYMLHAGGGKVRAQAGSGAGQMDNVIAQMTGQGELHLGTGVYANAYCESGFTRFASDADPTNLFVIDGARAHVLGASGGTAVTNAYVHNGGFLKLERDFGTVYVGERGVLEIEGDFITPTTINQHGGIIRYNGGNIGTLNAYAGVFDRLQGLRDVTITALSTAVGWQFVRSLRAVTTPPGSPTPFGSGSRVPVA